DTPYCLDGQTAARSLCVECIDDTQCDGGACNPVTHQCEPACNLSCPPAAPYCRDQGSVQCLADTHCPCGGTCDLTTNTSSAQCKTNDEWLGVEQCHWNIQGSARECALGPMPSGVSCGGTLASTCMISAGAARSAPIGALPLG